MTLDLHTLQTVRAEVKKEMDRKYECESAECSDIHIGRREMASDLLTYLDAEIDKITN